MHWNRAQLDISTCSSLSQLSPVVTKYLPFGAVIPSSDGRGGEARWLQRFFFSFVWDRLQVVAVTPFDHKSICTACLVGHNLSQSSWGPTQTICNHARQIGEHLQITVTTLQMQTDHQQVAISLSRSAPMSATCLWHISLQQGTQVWKWHCWVTGQSKFLPSPVTTSSRWWQSEIASSGNEFPLKGEELGRLGEAWSRAATLPHASLANWCCWGIWLGCHLGASLVRCSSVPAMSRPWGKSRTYWRDYTSQLIWEHIGVPLEEIERGKSELLRLLALMTQTKISSRWWMDGFFFFKPYVVKSHRHLGMKSKQLRNSMSSIK